MAFSKFARPVRRVTGKNGFSKTISSTEYNGFSEGSNTINLGICSIPNIKNENSIDSPWYVMGMAILRKILKKHYGVSVENWSQNIDTLVPPVFQTQSNLVETIPKLVQIKFIAMTQGNTVTPGFADAFTVVMPKTDAASRTVAYVASLIGAGIRQYFGLDYAEVVSGNHPVVGGVVQHTLTKRNTTELYGYCLEEYISLSGPDATPALTDASNRQWSTINRMDNWILDMSYITKIRIQNVSPADSGTTISYDSSAIERNPIVGKIYHFSDPYPVPSLKTYSVTYPSNYPSVGPGIGTYSPWSVFGRDTNGDGIVKPVPEVSENALRHIPTPDMFKNVKGYSLVKVMPGEIRTHKMVFKFNGFLNKLIQGLLMTSTFSGVDGATYATYMSPRNRGFGTFDMFCFEDYNGGHAANNNPVLGISYQVNRLAVCKVVKQTQKGMEIIRDYVTPVNAVNTDA